MATIKTSKGKKRLSVPKKTVKQKVRIIYREKEGGGSGGNGNIKFITPDPEWAEEGALYFDFSEIKIPLSAAVASAQNRRIDGYLDDVHKSLFWDKEHDLISVYADGDTYGRTVKFKVRVDDYDITLYAGDVFIP